ncbi:MAG: hypothetical protein ACC642_08000 [Pseudomonadales bacterium]
MFSLIDKEEMDEDIRELLEEDEVPPEAFLLALKNALVQLEHHAVVSHF